ncbi:MAG: hypothetical protein PHS32_00080 [Rhodoferax sp.]|uniref:hypothetical protein n=1 Tax=Rhodoferax sp. TaxID=50421 RepID=UPI002608BEBE|nr:hypothetical protein [Rhodoferax sp.]MDD5332113.1 hypothetical protein [Rhodoferax sp.]
MASDTTTQRQIDTRQGQAVRVADYLEQHPDSTAKEIDAACDTGCISKVLSDMRRMGYGIHKDRRFVPCAGGDVTRHVRTYALTHRPDAQPDLFTPA